MNNPFGFPEGETAQSHWANLIKGLPKDQKLKIAREVAQINEAGREILEDIFAWVSANGDFVLESNDCTRLHHLKDAFKFGKIIGWDSAFAKDNAFGTSAHPEHTFVVKHDWANAFSNAEGLSDSIKLPYDICAFEFRAGGRNVIAVAYGEESPRFIAFIQCGHYWACLGSEKDVETHIIQKIWNQIRAICVALDAEVASHSVERAPHKLNEKRIRDGKTPIPDFHVVQLAKRHRIANQNLSGGAGGKKRLHFRRGHWRHFEVSKTWIRWCLVGDPDLGFIHKHYTL